MRYNHQEIENKWQKYWQDNQTFYSKNQSKLPKYYVLDMFPYPSGAGLHVGHPLGYIASDIIARYKRHQGFNVMHPQGYDSFGLPAEQYAIETGQHPQITTQENITRYRKQLDRIGFSFDWSREIKTSSPSYYKHTQWIFSLLFNSWYDNNENTAKPIDELIKLFNKQGNVQINAVCDSETPIFDYNHWQSLTQKEKETILLNYRLAFLSDTEVNWCEALGTVLANDEIVNGVSERGGHPVVRKKMKQWSMRISAYAERLLEGLDQIDWSESLKDAQRNWIGKSTGAMVRFRVQNSNNHIDVFTTRADTIFGVSFLTLAPEHELVKKITTLKQKEQVENYIKETAKKSERDRLSNVKTISGVFTGAYANCPFTNQPIPIWIGDYVLSSYGTGAVMAVPCGDQRDYAFAKHFNLPIPNIFNKDISKEAYSEKTNFKLINSEFLNGLDYQKATKKIIQELEKNSFGYAKINYRLRDAVFSRQRYWGEPFPIYYKDGLPQLINASYLPINLPEVENYLPTSTGHPPLGNATNWAWDTQNNRVVSNELIDNKFIFPLELNTMPGWAGSSWYWLRYMDPSNSDQFASKQAIDYWQDVDLYIGGSEHATGHLLYSRFWNQFLYDRGFVQKREPFKKLINQGMILGTSAIIYRDPATQKIGGADTFNDQPKDPLRIDVQLVNASNEVDLEGLKNWQPQFKEASFELNQGKLIANREVEKMSKRWFNVVNPDDICEQFGADTLRLYEMFLGPLEQTKPWNTAGITGVYGFLKKLWKLYFNNDEFAVIDETASEKMLKILHQTIKKVTDDIEAFSFNTSVSQFMICVNELTSLKCRHRTILEPLIVLISPYAPHIAEELWSHLGHKESITKVKFPKFEPKYLVEQSKEYPVSFNGKMRFKINLPLDLSKQEIETIILNEDRTKKQLGDREPKKVIVVPGKIINIVG